MIKISEFSNQEIKVLKGKYLEFINELETCIKSSNLFKRFSSINPIVKRFESLSYEDTHLLFRQLEGVEKSGIAISWLKDNKFSSLVIDITTKQLERIEESKDFWGRKKVKEIYAYKQLSYNPIYLNEKTNAEQDDYNDDAYKKYLKLLESDELSINYEELSFLEQMNKRIIQLLNSVKIDSNIIQNELDRKKLGFLKEFSVDDEGLIKLTDLSSFDKLLKKNQSFIIDIDKTYIHRFIKISNYLKTKKNNIQKIFEKIKDSNNYDHFDNSINLLKNQIYLFNLLTFHSISMIISLVEKNFITFYEIYESLDRLNIFNSNWENEVSEKLITINLKLDDLIYSIYKMEQNIVNELSHLSYATQSSFEDLKRSVTNQLSEVESSINTNNLLTSIQTYQMYKINQNTKRLN
jgi:hypothetical protein